MGMVNEPSSREKWSILRENVRMFGLLRSAGDVLGYLFTAPPSDRFDRKYGVQTTGNVKKAQAGVTDPDAIRYVPISEQVMRHVMEHTASVVDPATMSFVDLGCGKGRALVIAAWYPFRSVLGVELSPLYAEQAQANVAAFLTSGRGPKVRCPDVSAICANALTCELPANDLFIFMNRPFKGQVFQGVLDRLAAIRDQTGRRVVVVYVCPMEELMLEQHPAFEKLQDHRVIVDEYRWSLWECR